MGKNAREIVKYDIITGDGVRDLQRRVSKSIEEGWQPQGGILFNREGYPMQTVVQYKSPNQD